MPTILRFGLSLILATVCAVAQAIPAGKVLIAVGEVSALRNGTTFKLENGSPLESGDAIQTGAASNAQLRFTDGSIVALRPESHFFIEAYKFAATNPGAEDESGVFSLVKGGLRTISGLIGKKNRDNYKMVTPTATVGIRGTHYQLIVCAQNCYNADGTLAKDGLYGGVLAGSIALNSQSGEAVFGKDEFFYLADANSKPEKLLSPPSFVRDKLDGQARSKKDSSQQQNTQTARTGEGQAPAEEQRSPVVMDVNVGPEDAQIKIAENEVRTLIENQQPAGQGNGQTPQSGNVMGVMIHNSQPGAFYGGEDWYPSERLLPVVFNQDGSIQEVSNWCSGCGANHTHVQRIAVGVTPAASAYESGSDAGVIAWGRWSGGGVEFGGWGPLVYGADQGLHFVVGEIATNLPTANQTVRYTMIGATAPTNNTNSLIQTGATSFSGYLDINFATRAMSSQFDVTTQNIGLRVTGTGSANAYRPAEFSLTGTTTRISGTANLCVSGCSTNMIGGFFGVGATHAGLSYRASDATNGVVEGVTVFKK